MIMNTKTIPYSDADSAVGFEEPISKRRCQQDLDNTCIFETANGVLKLVPNHLRFPDKSGLQQTEVTNV